MTDSELPAPMGPSPDILGAVLRHRVGVRAALEALERAVAAPSSGREAAWITGVVERQQALGTAFDHHIRATEAPDGLFAELVAHAPRLAHGVVVLQAEHVSIGDAITAAVVFGRGVGGPGGPAEVREAALDVMNRVTRHRHAGASLVFEAYNVDIEAAD